MQAGRWVWSVRVDVNVLDDDGNLAGAVSLAVRMFAPDTSCVALTACSVPRARRLRRCSHSDAQR